MAPEPGHWPAFRRIAAKETTLFFASPVAYLFLGCFLAVTLFVVFWVETFFARNIADLRPMFEGMPLLLAALCSSLTMRMWSEERRSGTLEHVLTQPVPIWLFVLGKFAGCLSLLATALLATLPLPATVSLLADLDWGPVGAGYLAALLLGAAYLAVGLWVSARTPNPMVSLLGSLTICFALYGLGSRLLTGLVSDQTAEILRQFGSGSRFEAIARGVIDFGDLAYYGALVVLFLTLNGYTLERERWSGVSGPRHRRWRAATCLLVAGALVVCLGAGLGTTRLPHWDVTDNGRFSLSGPTRDYLARLPEPLLIRGYFSARTHPLLAPLVPALKDLITEYGVAGGSRVKVEFVDPLDSPEVEEEASRMYGIKPMPFQVADRYQASIVSSYFSVLLKSGSDFKVLELQDFVQVGEGGEAEVSLRNPEFDLTRGMKKLVERSDKTVALVTPPGVDRNRRLTEALEAEFTVVREELSDGAVSPEVDLLLLAGPRGLDEKAVLAADQFLMRGGTVLAMTSPYSAVFASDGLRMSEAPSGLEGWLEQQGVGVEKALVMDPRSVALPLPVSRTVGGVAVQEIRRLDYPYFVDVRGVGFPADARGDRPAITSDLPQVTVAWPSPIELDQRRLEGRQVTPLLHSSAGSWLSRTLEIMPILDDAGNSGFASVGSLSPQLIGVAVSGRFESSFKDRTGESVLGSSAPGARIILFSSSDMLDDRVLQLQSGGNGAPYRNGLQMVANAIDWATESSPLLGIRARGNFHRTLPPMGKKRQMIWEATNYLLALLALAMIAAVRRWLDGRRRARYQAMMTL